MERISRKPVQGIGNIIRFNWHYYIIALVFVVLMATVRQLLPDNWSLFVLVTLLLTGLSILLSLASSFYIYDCSDLYSLNWLNSLNINNGAQLVNIHAGFDETSSLLSNKYPNSNLLVFDFYDPAKHTELSIARARKVYPSYPGTKPIDSTAIPLEPKSVDCAFAILSAHEIRNTAERVQFFTKLKKSLKEDGKLVVVEHTRNWSNFIAYNIGFFHFFSKKQWKSTFDAAGLKLFKENNINPFITVFILH